MNKNALETLLQSAREKITEIQPEEALLLLEQKRALFVDVRESEEFREGRIPGSVLIPRGVLEWKVEEELPDTSQKIVLYCGVGARSALAAAALKFLGYNNVSNLIGGIELWKEKNYPIEQ
jgi:rhodanese-related sulfurtransferase